MKQLCCNESIYKDTKTRAIIMQKQQNKKNNSRINKDMERRRKSIRLEIKTKCSGFVQICVIYCESGHLGSTTKFRNGKRGF